MRIIKSPYTNPFLNLSIEDYFLRSQFDSPILFFYVNRPCVVFGRFQNPWIESNLTYLKENDIWPVRRQSGGGCVFHDEGNLNYSFITPGPILDRDLILNHWKLAFQRIGILVEISPRHDLWLHGKKISGSAYKQTKFSCFHHGTMLINSDLDKLEKSLIETLKAKNSKSISSVRSKVTTLAEHFPGMEISDIFELMVEYFKTNIEVVDGSLLSHPDLQESFKKLRSWEWLWGETPEFVYESGELDLTVRKGQVLSPFEAKFNFLELKNHLSETELVKLFPDFSEQHNLSNQIF